MDSYMESHYNDDTNNNETQEQPNIGLLRFRSAPTTIFDDVTIQNGYSGLGLGSGSGGLPPQYPKPTMVRSSSRSMRKEVVKESRKQWISNIDRQTTSPPAAFFHCLNSRRGYNMMRGIGNFSGNGTHTESTNRLPMSHLPQISLIEAENVKETGSKRIYFGNNGEGVGETGFSFSYPYENGELATPHNVLVHHFSLPRTSAEITAAEKLMHFQDTAPWKIRAKRGYATHPRSIAERVRRNRISEKMRKLQCLVPSMDKQTNTADMLDLAVNYIRNLQDQYKVLSNVRARCKCVHLLE